MLRPRLIPSLLIHEKGLVKTIQFDISKYIGDPINAVKIFNEKEVDELAIFDIDASVTKSEPDYVLISKLASQSRMPLLYCGGVKTVDQAQKIFALGVEKIGLSSSAIDNPDLITEISKRVGAQSVVIVLDVKKRKLGGYRIFTHNGKKKTGICPVKFAALAQDMGAGEIVINSIDRDGTMNGYDMQLINEMRASVTLPMTVLGGAGSLKHLKEVVMSHGIIGVAAGSLFVFTGKYKAVLINYPTPDEKELICKTETIE